MSLSLSLCVWMHGISYVIPFSNSHFIVDFHLFFFSFLAFTLLFGFYKLMFVVPIYFCSLECHRHMNIKCHSLISWQFAFDTCTTFIIRDGIKSEQKKHATNKCCACELAMSLLLLLLLVLLLRCFYLYICHANCMVDENAWTMWIVGWWVGKRACMMPILNSHFKGIPHTKFAWFSWMIANHHDNNDIE